MKYVPYIIIGVTAVILLYFGIVNRDEPQPNNNQQESSAETVKNTWETKTSEEPPITIAVTPRELSAQSIEWKFNIGMNTHSVELDQDMIQSVALVDDKGNAYRPTAWEGPIGGHHREGVLIFAPITPLPEYIELRIKDIGGVPLRTLRWNLK